MNKECHRLRVVLEQWLVCCCLAGARTSSALARLVLVRDGV